MRLKSRPRRFLLVSTTLLFVGAGATFAALKWAPRDSVRQIVPFNRATRALETSFDAVVEPQVARVTVSDPIAQKIVAAARAQEGDAYDASYRQLAYPNGDVPAGGGACTDVIIRALRAAGYDLQKLIHQDMKRDFRSYPDPWKLGRTDKNIDHRRVPNHLVFFRKYGQSLPLETSGAALKTWLPGDIVCWKMDGGKWHTGIISDGIASSGKPLVVHNAWQCVEQDYLDTWPIIGHFRFPKR